jgi:hypothetical protein
MHILLQYLFNLYTCVLLKSIDFACYISLTNLSLPIIPILMIALYNGLRLSLTLYIQCIR